MRLVLPKIICVWEFSSFPVRVSFHVCIFLFFNDFTVRFLNAFFQWPSKAATTEQGGHTYMTKSGFAKGSHYAYNADVWYVCIRTSSIGMFYGLSDIVGMISSVASEIPYKSITMSIEGMRCDTNTAQQSILIVGGHVCNIMIVRASYAHITFDLRVSMTTH